MHYSMPYYNPNNFYRANQMNKSFRTLEDALALVKKAIQAQREDALFYDYLISLASTQEEKNIIATIRDDERKHNKYFSEIYKFYTGQNVASSSNTEFEKPTSYIDGIIKAKFDKLGAVERYRDIRAGIPVGYYQDMVFEILTDELKHAHKYDYLIYLSLINRIPSSNANWRSPETSPKPGFTAEEVKTH
jgi:rubrerythrin